MSASSKISIRSIGRFLFGPRQARNRRRSGDAPPRVSVVVPVFNKEQYLAECLSSLVDQTLEDIEILCVDDGSTDGSLGILEEFRHRDDRIRLISHRHNQGTMGARRSALLQATGDYLASVDADDVADREMLAKLHAAASNAGADFVQCNGYLVDPDHILPPGFAESFNQYLQKGAKTEFNGPGIFARYTSPIRVNLCLSLFSRDVYQAVTPFLAGDLPRRGDDNLLTFMFMFFCRKYVFVDEALYGYRANETSSNLRPVSPDLARSQIQGRAEALRFAKRFAAAVDLEWRPQDMPFSAFSYSIMTYSKSFIERCAAGEPSARDELIALFFEAFGEDARDFTFEDPVGGREVDGLPEGRSGARAES